MTQGLIFIQQKKSQGIVEETGYYFKDEFLSRYKTKAIEILRKRITKAGNGDFQEGSKKAIEEWKVINYEYKKSCEAIRRGFQTKKPFWDKQHKRVLERRIIRSNEKIEDLERRKFESVIEFDERIKIVKVEIEEIKQELGKNE